MKYLISEVKHPKELVIGGNEALGVGESIRMFFEEFFTETDRKLAAFKSSLHTIPYIETQTKLSKNGVTFIRNADKKITVPLYYQGGEGEMVFYVDGVLDCIMAVEGFKTELPRFYQWLKAVLRAGRIDRGYTWTITDYDTQVGKANSFIKELEEGSGKAPLGATYINFEEAFGLMSHFNKAVQSIKSRDAEVMARDLKNIYDIGELIIAKVKNNDIILNQDTINGIQRKVNQFNELTAIIGGSLGLINEMSAVFKSQCDEFNLFR